MWILDSLTDVPIKKPFFLLWTAPGAASLLLAYFFSQNQLYHPLIVAVFAAVCFYLWQTRKTALNAMMVPAIGGAAWLLLPNYPLLFCLIAVLLLGKFVFAEQFRMWKWLAASSLLWLSFPILSTWQSITELQLAVPYPFTTLIYSAVLAFCVQFSLLPYQVRKDSVVEAFEHYPWKTSFDAFTLAAETIELYRKIKQMVKDQETNPRIAQDLEDYTERVIHQCFRMHQITAELSNTNLASLEKQIAHLKQKMESVEDVRAKLQYEQALSNKQKQTEQFEKLRLQQERLLAQIVNYDSSLENIRLAYSHRDFQKSSGATENIELFMDVIKARAEGFHGFSEA
jgi:hypothetical protein